MASELSDEKGLYKYMLDNGMTVLLQEDNSSPVAAVNVWVKTGSACETEGEYGLAHVHEHMLFKGTEKRAVGEIARTIEAGGGDINAFTSFDETVYFIVSASRFLHTALDILADVMQNSTFDPDELEKEIEVVLEEIRRSKDSPTRVLSQELFSTAFEKHPYKRPILGTEESVRSFSREKIKEFYRKWYSPENMVLVVAGDFRAKELKPQIENTFGALERRGIPECVIPEEPEQTKLRTFVIERHVNEAYFGMGYHIPSAGHDDVPVLDVISSILGEGESSRLYREVKEREGIVNSIYSYSFTPRYAGLFFAGGTFNPEQSQDAYKEIIEQVYRLKHIPVGTNELAKAKLNIESDLIYSRETMQGLARKLGSLQVSVGDHRYEEKYLQKVREVTPDDIMRVAKKYFRTPNLTAGILFPTGQVHTDAGSLKQVIEETTSMLDERYSLRETDNRGEVTKKVLNNGITVLIRQNDSVPLFAARAVFLGGSRYETEETSGISNYVAEMLTRGTTSRTAQQIAVETESMAGEIDGFSGRNSIGVTVESLSRNFNETMDIFADVIRNPSFPEEEIERARRVILSSMNRQKDNLVRKTVNIFLENLFTDHPYRFNILGTEDTVRALGREDLAAFYNKVFQPENMVIAVVGDVDTSVVLKNIEKNFGDMDKGEFYRRSIEPQRKREEIKMAEHFVTDRAQTHIILGYTAPDIKSEDRYAFEVLNTVLSGQGGRLFFELRDRMSLAYTVTSFYTPGIENGYFGVYIGTAPDKETDAVEGIKNQLIKLLDEGITADELERARNYIAGSFEIGLQRNSAQAAQIAFDQIYSLGWDEFIKYPENILAVTKGDVLNVARKYIDIESYTLAVVKNEDMKEAAGVSAE